MDNDQTVEDAEIVEEITTEETTTPPSAKSVLGVAELIKRYMGDIEKTKNLLKEQKAMFKDAFENDKEYHDEQEKIKDLNRKKKTIQDRILKTPAMEAVTAKVKAMTEELKDMEDALSGYIQEHIRQTGSTMIEGNDGEMYEMVPVYKLRKKSGKYNP